MPFPDFFNQFGIYSEYDFLAPEFCRQLCSEMVNATATVGGVWNEKNQAHIIEEVKKRTEFINLPSETNLQIREKLLAIMPKMAEHFQVELTDVQPIKFTRYNTGDYYRMHLDVSPHGNAPADIDSRKVSIIIFLNQEGENLTEGDYIGGNLTFYGLLDDPSWRSVGLPLESEEGLLLAFRPTTLHEVTTVTEGTRYTITTWFV